MYEPQYRPGFYDDPPLFADPPDLGPPPEAPLAVVRQLPQAADREPVEMHREPVPRRQPGRNGIDEMREELARMDMARMGPPGLPRRELSEWLEPDDEPELPELERQPSEPADPRYMIAPCFARDHEWPAWREVKSWTDVRSDRKGYRKEVRELVSRPMKCGALRRETRYTPLHPGLPPLEMEFEVEKLPYDSNLFWDDPRHNPLAKKYGDGASVVDAVFRAHGL